MTRAAPAARDEGETGTGLALVVRHALEGLGLEVTAVEAEPDNAGYGALLVHVTRHDVAAGGAVRHTVRVRSGKVTPTKVGLFVTHWRRTSDGTTGPYDEHDSADVLVVTVTEASHPGASSSAAASGMFVFRREALLAHGILARPGEGGKRGFRVYPPWAATAPGQATRTRRWQLEYFVALPLDDAGRARASTVMGLAPGARPTG